MVIITGCLGFIGFWLAKALLEQGYRVTGIDLPVNDDNVLNAEKYALLNNFDNFSIIFKNLYDVDFENILIKDNIQYIFHFAAKSQVRRDAQKSLNNFIEDIAISQKILDAAIGKNIKKIVFASSASVYGNMPGFMKEDNYPRPLSHYGISKLTIENLFHSYWVNHGVPAVSMRFFTVYGEYQPMTMGVYKFIENLIDDKEILLFNSGLQKRDFVNIRDVIAANLKVFNSNDETISGKVYNIGTGVSHDLTDVVNILEEISSKKALTKSINEGHIPILSTLADISKAKNELHYMPATSLTDGLKMQYDWIVKLKKKEKLYIVPN